MQTVVLGAGPAGLSAAYELSQHHRPVTVLEQSNHVGGLARTEHYQDCCIDFGWGSLSGHCGQHEQDAQDESVEAARQLWHELAGEAWVDVEVRSRIHYRHRLFEHPLSFTNALKHLGPIDISLAGFSYLKHHFTAQQRPEQAPRTAGAWIDNQFGPHLNRIFFDAYFQKVWGRSGQQLAPCSVSQLLSQQSRKSKSLLQVASAMFLGAQVPTVRHPKQGAGQIWETCKKRLEAADGNVFLDTQLLKLEHTNCRITQAIATHESALRTIPISNLVSSLPLSELTARLNAPVEIQQAARQLQHRHLLQVALILDIKDLFPEQWLYVHCPAVNVSRIQNFKNWSSAMVSNPNLTCLGLTYFCSDEDARWHIDPSKLLQMASQELVELGLIPNLEPILSGSVMRQPYAYPIYTPDTLQPEAIVQDYLSRFENLQTVGRSGQHHSGLLETCVLSGQLAAKKILENPVTAPRNVLTSPVTADYVQ
ncbi:MAG: FAD-dependent oxidoreductase [Cyanobacteria bacterium J06614_10]